MAKSRRGGCNDVQLLAGQNRHLEGREVLGQEVLQFWLKATDRTEEEDDCASKRRVHVWRKREHRRWFSCVGSLERNRFGASAGGGQNLPGWHGWRRWSRLGVTGSGCIGDCLRSGSGGFGRSFQAVGELLES